MLAVQFAIEAVSEAAEAGVQAEGFVLNRELILSHEQVQFREEVVQHLPLLLALGGGFGKQRAGSDFGKRLRIDLSKKMFSGIFKHRLFYKIHFLKSQSVLLQKVRNVSRKYNPRERCQMLF